MVLINKDMKFLSIFQYIVNCSINSNSLKTMKSENTNSSFNKSSIGNNFAKDVIGERKSMAHTPNSFYTSESN